VVSIDNYANGKMKNYNIENKPMIIYAGQEVTTNNWFTHIDPTDERFYNVKAVEYTPKTIEEIEKEYNISIECRV
jgi:hypothetical protein